MHRFDANARGSTSISIKCMYVLKKVVFFRVFTGPHNPHALLLPACCGDSEVVSKDSGHLSPASTSEGRRGSFRREATWVQMSQVHHGER